MDPATAPHPDRGQPDTSGPDDESVPGRGRRALRATGRGVAATGRASKRAASSTLRRARRASHAQGAGGSGLARLIELHAFNAAGDAAVAISLAGTIFFADPGSARGPVALFLGLTMLPFAVVAPLIGPFLDRFSHGRRWAIGGTFAVRGLCCLVAADAVASGSLLMYPAVLGCLVCSKAYGVARAATVPRLMPADLTLVKANSRISLAGIVGAAVSGPLAAGAAYFGGEWSLRYAFLVFAAGTILAILLPAASDASAGEQQVTLTHAKHRFQLPGTIVFALRCNAGLRMLSGFLTMYMAFLLTQHPLPGFEDRRTLLLALVIGAAGLGNAVGIGLGTLLRKVNPVAHGRVRAAGRRGHGAGLRGVLRTADRGAPRPDRRCRPGARQALAGLADPARRPRTRPYGGLRAVRDAAPAVLGRRRLHRHRAAAGARHRAGRAGRADDRVDRVRRAQPAADGHRVGLTRAGTGEPGRGSAQSSSSSASPRRSFAVGFAVRASGWRPWR